MAQVFLLNLLAELCIRICVADAQLCPQLYMGEVVSWFLYRSVLCRVVILQQCHDSEA